jgi:CRP-like cAMP-binding protein
MPDRALFRTLSLSPVFSQADPAALTRLAANATPVSLHAGEHLFKMGDAAHYFYCIKTGSVSLYRPCYNGSHKVFRVMETGDILGEASMFLTPCTYPLSAQACVHTNAYRMHREHLLAIARESASFCYAMTQSMAQRLSQSINRIDLLTIGNSAQRLVTYLMDLYMQQRTTWLTLPTSHSVLARQLNIAAETFSRQLNGFKRAGYLEGRQRHLVLLDVDALCRAVDLPPPVANPMAAIDGAQNDSLFDCCPYASQPLGMVSI